MYYSVSNVARYRDESVAYFFARNNCSCRLYAERMHAILDK